MIMNVLLIRTITSSSALYGGNNNNSNKLLLFFEKLLSHLFAYDIKAQLLDFHPSTYPHSFDNSSNTETLNLSTVMMIVEKILHNVL